MSILIKRILSPHKSLNLDSKETDRYDDDGKNTFYPLEVFSSLFIPLFHCVLMYKKFLFFFNVNLMAYTTISCLLMERKMDVKMRNILPKNSTYA